MFCRSLFVLLYFFFWPLFVLRYTDSDYPFDIFKLFLFIKFKIKTLYNPNSVGMTLFWNNSAHPMICEGCHFTHICQTIARCHHFTEWRLSPPPFIKVYQAKRVSAHVYREVACASDYALFLLELGTVVPVWYVFEFGTVVTVWYVWYCCDSVVCLVLL